MSAAVREQGRWVAAATAALAAVAAALALFRLPPRAARPPAGPKPTLGLATLDPVQTQLNDPQPLFLPTEWNASPRVAPPDSAASFRDYDARFAFPPAELASPLAWPPFALPRGPAEALAADRPGNPFGGIGRRDVPLPALAPRGAFVEVSSAATGEVVLARAIPDAHPPGDTTLYQLEFSATVDPAGLVGPLKREDSLADSRWPVAEALSAYFQDYLDRVFRLGNRLPPGSYRIRVGP